MQVAFTITQDVDDAPVYMPEASIRLRLDLPLRLEIGTYRVDPTHGSTTPQHDKC